jgi:hypothetical protein
MASKPIEKLIPKKRANIKKPKNLNQGRGLTKTKTATIATETTAINNTKKKV